MKHGTVAAAYLVAAMFVSALQVHAQGPPDQQARPARMRDAVVIGEQQATIRLMPLKDPNLAAILALGTPGMGHFYVGNWKRGAAFLTGVMGSVVAVGLAGDNLALTVEDYDTPARGGNANGVVEVAEYRAWEKKRTRDLSEISTARKAVMLTGLTSALGLYVWNIFDAHSQAEDYNRQLYRDLTGVRVGLCPGPHGMRGMMSVPIR